MAQDVSVREFAQELIGDINEMLIEIDTMFTEGKMTCHRHGSKKEPLRTIIRKINDKIGGGLDLYYKSYKEEK